MVLFGLINYEDYILKKIVLSSYSKDILAVSIAYILTGILRFHLSIFLICMLSMENYFDYVIPIIINILLSRFSEFLYAGVNTKKHLYIDFVNYIIDNYSFQNVIRWKRYVLVVLFCYSFVVLSIAEFNNKILMLSLLQTAISFILCDLIENFRTFKYKILSYLNHYYYRPKVTKIIKDFELIPGYPNRSNQFMECDLNNFDKEDLDQLDNFEDANKNLIQKIDTPPTRRRNKRRNSTKHKFKIDKKITTKRRNSCPLIKKFDNSQFLFRSKSCNNMLFIPTEQNIKCNTPPTVKRSSSKRFI